ncbi:hypothetical protein Micbo1qcDRAFT_233855 [Microdochium bolleyi]|uniref:Uncharacterized protein n=1 Tax=Microdochium bolleyi TaxID=196109 RepID=A0A136J2E7_9PEZI|nr:hypothetical protein Micbo1qcDRAFT_233855 [Microdochium bolleyi]
MAGSQIDELDYLADHALQARLFKISTEQQSLLSKDDAWTISPSNIPKAVLEHVTAHLQRQKVAASTSGNTQEQAEDPPTPARSPSELQEFERFDSQPPEESSADENVVSVPLHPVAKTPNKASVGNPPEETSPFKSFCAAYVTYTGNTRSFVTACIYIQLQHKKIRSSLYDDFIRAWHEGYYAYVRKCDSAVPPVPAAHAYAWYNEMDDDPLYTLRVITKQNLESVLDAYPDEVEDAQRRLGIVSEKKQAPSRQAEELVLVPSVPQETRAPTLPPAEAPILIDEDEDGNDNGEQIAGERTLARAEASPECSMLEGCPVELSPIDFSKSMSEIDLGRQSAKEPVVRSLVRAGVHRSDDPDGPVSAGGTAVAEPGDHPATDITSQSDGFNVQPRPSHADFHRRETATFCGRSA